MHANMMGDGNDNCLQFGIHLSM